MKIKPDHTSKNRVIIHRRKFTWRFSGLRLKLGEELSVVTFLTTVSSYVYSNRNPSLLWSCVSWYVVSGVWDRSLASRWAATSRRQTLETLKLTTKLWRQFPQIDESCGDSVFVQDYELSNQFLYHHMLEFLFSSAAEEFWSMSRTFRVAGDISIYTILYGAWTFNYI